MRSLLSKRAFADDLIVPRLEAIWYAEADETYDVNRRNHSLSGYVAVRTLSGKGRMTLYDGRTLILEGNSIGVFEGAQIARYATDGQNWQFYWFEFQAEGWSSPLLGTVRSVSSSAQERVELERCFDCLNRNASGSCSVAESLFCYLLADWQQRTEEKPSNSGLLDVLSLLEKGRRERISIPEMARMAGMCERSFRSAVQEETGLSPKMYMIRGEMSAAMELLRTTNMSVAEIAACLDYARPSYFSRAFKKYYGVSPQFVRIEMQL
ncbi:MAG: helix-turn-helix transcriptional regulator [Clostridia bacterium]|nr:helix-turn-helix transcriptional regulator [Clostridia bacterium]